MPALIIRHRVADFDNWKPKFDEHQMTRQSYGLTGHKLYRLTRDPNDLLIVFECEDLERARALADSAEIKLAMQEAGVVGTPTYFYLEDIEEAAYGKELEAPRPEASPLS